MFYIGSILTAIATFFGIKIARKILTFGIFMSMIYFLLDYSFSYVITTLDLSTLPNNFLYILCKFEIIKILNFYISSETAIFLLRKTVNFWTK